MSSQLSLLLGREAAQRCWSCNFRQDEERKCRAEKRPLAGVEAGLDAEKRKHAALLIEVDDEAEKRAQERKLRRTVRGAKVCKKIYILNLYSPLLLSTPL